MLLTTYHLVLSIPLTAKHLNDNIVTQDFIQFIEVLVDRNEFVQKYEKTNLKTQSQKTHPTAIMSKTAATVKDVNGQKFVVEYANFLKKTGKIELPAWVDIVKTAAFKEHSPYNKDWFYIRCGMY